MSQRSTKARTTFTKTVTVSFDNFNHLANHRRVCGPNWMVAMSQRSTRARTTST
jgi:hypothetical protein